MGWRVVREFREIEWSFRRKGKFFFIFSLYFFCCRLDVFFYVVDFFSLGFSLYFIVFEMFFREGVGRERGLESFLYFLY